MHIDRLESENPRSHICDANFILAAPNLMLIAVAVEGNLPSEYAWQGTSSKSSIRHPKSEGEVIKNQWLALRFCWDGGQHRTEPMARVFDAINNNMFLNTLL